MKSFVLKIHPPQGIAAANRDALAQLLVRVGEGFGLQGMEDWAVDLGNSTEVLAIAQEFHDLSGRRDANQPFQLYFSERGRARDFAKVIRHSLPELKVEEPTAAARVDWVSRWKKYYKPIRLQANRHTPALWILPAWKKRKLREGELAIKIEPGQAFGTGTHATTQLCLELFLQESPQFSKRLQIFDFGAGTGVLALGAAAWARKERRPIGLVCSEIEPEARMLMKVNLRLNRVRAKVTTGLPTKQYDLVFANVLSPVLLQYQRELWQGVKPGGYLILSGVLAREGLNFIQQFLPGEHFRQRGMSVKGDWCAFLLQK